MLKEKIDSFIQEESKRYAEEKTDSSRKRIDTLRLIKADLVTAEKKLQTYDKKAEDSMLVKMAKERQEAAAEYEKYGRHDLARKELDELEVINEFAPHLPTDDELKELSEELVAEYAASMGDGYALSMRDMKALKAAFSEKFPYSDASCLASTLQKFISGTK